MEPSSIDFVVLLVLALGGMCLHTASSSPIDVNDTKFASHTHPDCKLQNKVFGLTSSPQCGCGQFCASLHNATDIECYVAKYVENASVPESFYLRAAKQFSVNLDHDNDLLVAQSHLLLGLYKAHKAGIKEGSASFRSAGNKLHDLLIQRNLLTGSAEVQILSQNQLLPTGQPAGVIVWAATSCLRLENIQNADTGPGPSQLYHPDILPLPFSSPASPTGYLPTANMNKYRDTFFQDHVALAILERQYHDFSRELKRHSDPSCIQFVVPYSTFEHGKALLDFKNCLPQVLELDNNECVPPDALRARLRARSYETTYRIYRPFLEFVLHILPHLKNGLTVTEVVKFKGESLCDEGDICRFEAFVTMDGSIIDECCEQCIEAATMSAYGYSKLFNYPGPLGYQDIAYA
jgi:hypothetical protein